MNELKWILLYVFLFMIHTHTHTFVSFGIYSRVHANHQCMRRNPSQNNTPTTKQITTIKIAKKRNTTRKLVVVVQCTQRTTCMKVSDSYIVTIHIGWTCTKWKHTLHARFIICCTQRVVLLYAGDLNTIPNPSVCMFLSLQFTSFHLFCFVFIKYAEPVMWAAVVSIYGPSYRQQFRVCLFFFFLFLDLQKI